MNDKLILQNLAREKLEIASGRRNIESIKKWTACNDLKMSKPPVYIKEIPWHEINSDSLKCRCQDEFLQSIELAMRREIYIHNTFVTDNTVSGYIECPLAFGDNDIGICEYVDIVRTDKDNDIVSRHFNILIKDFEDISKIKDPIITVDDVENQRRMNVMTDILGSIMPIALTGSKGLWFTPWDNLVRLTGVEELYYDLIDRPEYIHALLRRFLDSYLVKLNKYKELGIWASNNDGSSIGSGGCGHTNQLERHSINNVNVSTRQIWGCGNAQIFSEVSSSMHKEFSLDYEMEWLSNFGLNYYGCCEPLSSKIDILKKIPNLRKISMSPWANLEQASEQIGKQFVMSCKPNPAMFAVSYNEVQIRKDMQAILDKTRGNNIEIVMKDISTIYSQPENIAKWSRLLSDMVC